MGNRKIIPNFTVKNYIEKIGQVLGDQRSG